MIWIILIILCLIAALFLFPVLAKAPESTARDTVMRELDASKAQLRQIESEIESGFQDEESAARAKRSMQRRILSLSDRLDTLSGDHTAQHPAWLKYAVLVVIFVGVGILYPVIGQPFLKPISQEAMQAVQRSELATLSPTELIKRMEDSLAAADAPDPTGYLLLARAKLELNDADGAITAYQVALEASGGDERILTEMKQVQDIIDAKRNGRPPALDQEAIDTFQGLSEDERNTQIRGMVDGLAARLENEPENLEGWLRLIRARTVLGDQEAALQALASAKTHYSGRDQEITALDELATSLNLSKNE